MTRRPDAVGRTLLLALVASVPLVTTLLPGVTQWTHDGFELPKAVLARVLATAAALALAVAVGRDGRELRLGRSLVPLALWVGWTALATALSTSPAVSLLGAHGRLDGLLAVATYATLGFVAMQLFSTGGSLQPLARALVVSGLAVCAHAALQGFGADPFVYLVEPSFGVGRVFATTGNPVFLAGLLVLVLPVAVGTALADDARGWRTAGVIASALSAGVLAATATRGAWLAAALEVVLLVVIVLRKRVRLGVLGAALGVSAAASVAGVTLASRTGGEGDVLARVGSVFGPASGSVLERLLVWRAALGAIAERPLVGFGPSRFSAAFERFRPAEHAERFAGSGAIDNAHSYVLGTAATAGLVAAIAWLGAVLVPLAASAGAVFSSEGGATRTRFATIWVACLGYAVFLASGIGADDSMVPFWVLLGAVMAASASTKVTVGARTARMARFAFSAALIAAIVTGGLLLAADARYLQARRVIRGVATGDAVALSEDAARLSPLDAFYRKGVVFARSAPGADEDPAYVAALEDALALEPEDLDVLALELQARHARGEAASESALAEELLQLAPNNPQVAAIVDATVGP